MSFGPGCGRRAYAVTAEEAGDLAQILTGLHNRLFLRLPGRELMSYKRPNNRGIRLGRVKGFDRKSRLVEISLEEPLGIGDGIEVWVTREAGPPGSGAHPAGGQARGIRPGRCYCATGNTRPGFPGDRVFKTHDARLMEGPGPVINLPVGSGKYPLSLQSRAVWASR